MDDQFKDFYDILRENLDSYRGEYDKFIDYSPDLFKLLTDILNEDDIEPEIRLKICAAIAYFVAPYDIIPEQIYGPQGYIDDIYLCAYIINDLVDSIGWEKLEEVWQGDEELQEIVNECYNKSEEILGEKKDQILIYVGLK